MRFNQAGLLGLTTTLLFSATTFAQDDDMELLEAELSAEEMALLEELQEESDESFKPSLRIYGFMDFTAGLYLTGGTSFAPFFDSNTDFYVGNINTYIEGQLSPQWKSLVEVRFLFLPDGNPVGDRNFLNIVEPQRERARAEDYADFTRQFTWGGVEIERAHIDYQPFGFLKFRVGRFLTPYGIWNVDHGTPVIVSTRRPFLVGEELFPERQTGIEVHGSIALRTISLTYHLTASNGRGPIEAYGDLDDNKALGGRIQMNALWFGDLQLGASTYFGTYTDKRQRVDPATIPTGNPQLENVDLFAFTEAAFGFDFRWKWSGILLQSELVWNDRQYDDDKREFGSTGTELRADVRELGVYALVGYELPWIPLMPFFLYQYYDAGVNYGLTIGQDEFMGFEPGINARILPNVVLKTTFGAIVPVDPRSGIIGEDTIYRWESQIAVAF